MCPWSQDGWETTSTESQERRAMDTEGVLDGDGGKDLWSGHSSNLVLCLVGP